MKKLLMLFVLLFFIFQAFGAKTQDFNEVDEIASVIYDLVKTAPRRKLARNFEFRKKLASEIYLSSIKYEVPELLLTVKLFNESSFRSNVISKDKYKTQGIGQMHGVAIKGCNISTRPGQIDCAAKWLRACYDKCTVFGWAGALTAYGTSGHCYASKAANPERYKRSIMRQMKTWFMFEQQRDAVRKEIISDLEYYSYFR